MIIPDVDSDMPLRGCGLITIKSCRLDREDKRYSGFCRAEPVSSFDVPLQKLETVSVTLVSRYPWEVVVCGYGQVVVYAVLGSDVRQR